MKRLIPLLGLLMTGILQADVTGMPYGWEIQPNEKAFGDRTGATLSATTSGLIIMSGGVNMTLNGASGAVDTINVPLFGKKQRLSFMTTITATGVAEGASEWGSTPIIMPSAGSIIDIRTFSYSAASGVSLNVYKNSTVMYTAAGAKLSLSATTNATQALPTSFVTFTGGDVLRLTLETAHATAAKWAQFTVDLDRNVETATSLGEVLVPRSGQLIVARCNVVTAPLGASLLVRVLINGTATTTLTVVTGSTSSDVFTTATSVAAGDRITVDVIQVGSTTAGAGLTVVYAIRRTTF